jgi:uncharacterized protein (UPF0147 family)
MFRTKRQIQKLLAEIETDTSTPDYIQEKANKIRDLLPLLENEAKIEANKSFVDRLRLTDM